MIAVPVALAVVTAFHPNGHRHQVFAVLAPQIGRWLAVHYLQLVLVPLLAVVLFALLRGATGAWAATARIATYVFAVFYTVFDSLAGLAVGSLVQHASTLPAAEQATLAPAIQWLFGHPILGGLGVLAVVATTAWLVACIASAMALRRCGLSAPGQLALVLGGILLTPTHAPPFGPLAFGIFAAATAIATRASARQRSSPLETTAA
jgi:hypothetical protein